MKTGWSAGQLGLARVALLALALGLPGCGRPPPPPPPPPPSAAELDARVALLRRAMAALRDARQPQVRVEGPVFLGRSIPRDLEDLEGFRRQHLPGPEDMWQLRWGPTPKVSGYFLDNHRVPVRAPAGDLLGGLDVGRPRMDRDQVTFAYVPPPDTPDGAVPVYFERPKGPEPVVTLRLWMAGTRADQFLRLGYVPTDGRAPSAVHVIELPAGRPYRILGEELFHLTLWVPLPGRPAGRLDLEVLGRPSPVGDPWILAAAQ